MVERCATLLIAAQEAISKVSTFLDLDVFRAQYLGKNGCITAQLKNLSAVALEDRKIQGQALHALKLAVSELIESKKQTLTADIVEKKIQAEYIDVTLPGRHGYMGSRHPISKTRLRIEQYFQNLGFELAEGPHIETEYYNFEALNIPAHHPARAMQDTFYGENGYLLRTHTSPVQVRYMQTHQPPFQMIASGRVYRSDSDITHTPMFHQIECLMVDRTSTMAQLKTILRDFLTMFFETDCRLRFRSSYFPFTEPSAEVDVSCVACNAKDAACKVCKGTGWLEVLGCGMIHPQVLQNVHINPEVYQGFAIGMGLERLTMLRYQVPDLRQFFESDVRFLQQFTSD